MKRCSHCQAEVSGDAQFCNRCGLSLIQVPPLQKVVASNSLLVNREPWGSFLPPWLWFWLIAYPVLQLPGLLQLWSNNVQQLFSQQPSDFLIMSSPQFSFLTRFSSFVGFLSLAALALGIISIFLPWMRSAYLERKYRLAEVSVELPALKEIRQFAYEYAPALKVKINLLRGDQLAFVYPLGYRVAALALFGGIVKLWYSDREAAEAVLLHEIAHYRHGDFLIVGAGSFLETVVRFWLPFFFVFVLIPEILALVGGGISFLAVSGSPFALLPTLVLPLVVLRPFHELFFTANIFILPLVGIWCAELNADRFVVDTKNSAKDLLRAFEQPFSRYHRLRWLLFRTSHPPMKMRKWLAEKASSVYRTLGLLLIFPFALLLHGLTTLGFNLTTVFDQFVVAQYGIAQYINAHVPVPASYFQYYPQAIHDVFTGYQYYVGQVILWKWIPMLILILLWPFLAQYWERIFSKGRGTVRLPSIKLYFFGVITMIGISIIFWILIQGFLTILVNGAG